jgi:hypothetical protein
MKQNRNKTKQKLEDVLLDQSRVHHHALGQAQNANITDVAVVDVVESIPNGVIVVALTPHALLHLEDVEIDVTLATMMIILENDRGSAIVDAAAAETGEAIQPNLLVHHLHQYRVVLDQDLRFRKNLKKAIVTETELEIEIVVLSHVH